MTAKLPVDAPRSRVIKALENLGFRLVREREHIAMIRENPDGSKTPLTMPGHLKIKGGLFIGLQSDIGLWAMNSPKFSKPPSQADFHPIPQKRAPRR